MSDPTPDPLPLALAFARDHLGQRSTALLEHPEAAPAVRRHVALGFDPRDAALAHVHRHAADDPRLADEFIAYFLRDMLRIGAGALRAGLRRYLDTGDLVQSVLGDLWPELCNVTFESRARFVSLLARRLSWKAGDHVRRLEAGVRREDLRNTGAELGGAAQEEPGPSTRAELGEDEERLALVLHRLSERDARLLRLRLGGSSIAEVAERLGLSAEAAKKALTRAKERAKTLLGDER